MSAFASLLPWFLRYGYVALFAILLLCGLYLPLPSNIALMGAGALSHVSEQGLHFNFFLAAIVALAGNIVSDVTVYSISRKFSTPKRRSRFEKKHTSYRKLEGHMKRHPLVTVGITRVIGFLSPAVNALSGFSKLPIRTFILGDILGNSVYVLLFMGIGYFVESISSNVIVLVSVGTAILLILAGLYIGTILFLREK